MDESIKQNTNSLHYLYFTPEDIHDTVVKVLQ